MSQRITTRLYSALPLPLQEAPALGEAAYRELVRVEEAVNRSMDLEVSYEPATSVQGMVRVFDPVVWDPQPGDPLLSGFGPYFRYDNDEWHRLVSARELAQQLPLKTLAFRYVGGTGLLPEFSFNVFDVVDQGSGNWRARFNVSEAHGLTLVNSSNFYLGVQATGLPAPGFVQAVFSAQGADDGSGRSFVDFRLVAIEEAPSGGLEMSAYLLAPGDAIFLNGFSAHLPAGITLD